MEKMNLLWTGGFDSTYMLINELRKGKTIQPIYVLDYTRDSTKKELETMNKILEKIKEKNSFGGEVLPIKEYDLKTLEIDEEIIESWENIRKKIKIGTQYQYTAVIGRELGDVSLGIEKPNGEFSGCIEAIKSEGNLIRKKDSYYVSSDSSRDILNIFGNCNFPICDITEVEMLDNIRKWDVVDIMENIWFCHRPTKRETPCGVCRPCQQKMECEMQFLVPIDGQRRYNVYKKIEKVFGSRNAERFSRILRKIICK